MDCSVASVTSVTRKSTILPSLPIEELYRVLRFAKELIFDFEERICETIPGRFGIVISGGSKGQIRPWPPFSLAIHFAPFQRRRRLWRLRVKHRYSGPIGLRVASGAPLSSSELEDAL